MPHDPLKPFPRRSIVVFENNDARWRCSRFFAPLVIVVFEENRRSMVLFSLHNATCHRCFSRKPTLDGVVGWRRAMMSTTAAENEHD